MPVWVGGALCGGKRSVDGGWAMLEVALEGTGGIVGTVNEGRAGSEFGAGFEVVLFGAAGMEL